jgi:hypothetical protein
VTAAIYRAP